MRWSEKLDSSAWEARLPLVEREIDRIAEHYKDQARPISELGFTKLAKFFPPAVLDRMKYVVVETLPIPFANQAGHKALEALHDVINPTKAAAIVLKDTIYLKEPYLKNESFFCHELIHTLQWEQLGTNEFLKSYTNDFSRFLQQEEKPYKAYRKVRMEEMAFGLQDFFDLKADSMSPGTVNMELLVHESLKTQGLMPRALAR